MNSTELERCEIIDWWEAERARVSESCAASCRSIEARARREVAALTRRDLLLPGSRQRRDVIRHIERGINSLAVRLETSLRESLQTSLHRIEGTTIRGLEIGESLTFAAALLTGGGALVGGGMAAVAATTTVTTGFWFFASTSVVISWPVLAAGATGALTLAALSPRLVDRAEKMRREKIADHLAATIWDRLMNPDPGARHPSIRATLLAALDTARNARLARLESP